MNKIKTSNTPIGLCNGFFWGGAFYAVTSLLGCSSGDATNPKSSPTPAPSPIVTNPTPRWFADISNLTGIDFIFGYAEPLFSFSEEFSGGVAVGDYDLDGDVDLFVVRGNIAPNLLLRNMGGNHFDDVAASSGVAITGSGALNPKHTGPVFVDLNGDNYVDLFIGATSGAHPMLFMNNRDGTFSDVSKSSGVTDIIAENTVSAAFGDYDLDGDLDLLLSHWGVLHSADTETLWRNDSTVAGVKFTSASIEARVAQAIIPRRGGMSTLSNSKDRDYSFTPAFVNLNNDRAPDILMVSDFKNSRVLMNNAEENGATTFSDVTDNSVIKDENGMGLAVGDFDNDGNLDWFVTGISGPGQIGNRLYRNLGAGKFADITVASGVANGDWGWGACAADFNLDGLLDIYHTNGFKSEDRSNYYENDSDKLFINQGNTQFLERASELGVLSKDQGRAVVCADFDRDGDVDIFTLTRGFPLAFRYFRNEYSKNNSIRIRLKGDAPNTHAANSQIFIENNSVIQMREVLIGGSFSSQPDIEQIFGIGEFKSVDKIRVVWPDGKETILNNVASGFYQIDYPVD